ncbi:MAG: AAA family ATPase [Chloroflexota bacterium]
MSSDPERLVRIHLLGRFEIARGPKVLTADRWLRRKAAALMQRLALEKRLLRDQALDFLWPDAHPSAAANNLYRTLYAVRQTLDEHLGPGTAAATFSFVDGVLILEPAVWVDAHQFEQLCAVGRSSVPDLQRALNLYQGELLPDERYADWTIGPREALQRLYRQGSLDSAAHLAGRGDYDQAIARLLPLLGYDHADEIVHRELMRLYALAGRRHDALRQYQSCVEALAEELNVSPDPQTEELYNSILAGQLYAPPAPGPKLVGLTPAPLAVEMEPGATLAGRQAEMDKLRTALTMARRGQGSVILISGDSGMGKTRLAYEALREAAASGMVTLTGAAYEQEGQITFQPFIEAINRYLADHHQPLNQNPITHFKPLGTGDPQQEQWALFNATAAFLSGLAGSAPVVMLLDDLHAADEASLRLFHFLARHTRNVPLILLVTYRTDVHSDPVSPFGSLLNALYRERLRIDIPLASLAREAVEVIATDRLGSAVDPHLVEAIYGVTEGNPFFTEEVCRALREGQQVERREGQWRLKTQGHLVVPPGLSELLHQQVARLGPAVVSSLESASISGREFSFRILQSVSVLTAPDLLDALDKALAAHLIEETAAGYRFRHNLIRGVLYDGQSRPRRARLHAVVARAVEAAYESRPGGLQPYVEALAHHYLLSDTRERALPYLVQAGEKAARLFAFEVAVDYFEQALALLGELQLDDPPLRWKILESLGWWGIILANTPRAVARFEEALALPPRGNWQSQRQDRVRLHCGAATALLTAGDTQAADTHLQTALLEVNEEDDAAEYTDLLYNLSLLHWHRNEYQAAFDVAQRSLTIAERLNNAQAIARAFEMLALACHSLGEWQLGLSFEEQRARLTGHGLDVTDAFDVHL